MDRAKLIKLGLIAGVAIAGAPIIFGLIGVYLLQNPDAMMATWFTFLTFPIGLVVAGVTVFYALLRKNPQPNSSLVMMDAEQPKKDAKKLITIGLLIAIISYMLPTISMYIM